MIKNPSALQEMGVRSLGWEDPLEYQMATHSSVLGWEIPWIEEPIGLQSTGVTKSDTPEHTCMQGCHGRGWAF